MSAAAAQVGDLILPKGEAARELNVSPGRVSQYIAEGKIYGDAIVGEGRSAKINVTIARQQLRSSLDIGQRFGNGIGTDLADREVAASGGQVDDLVSSDDSGGQMAVPPLREIRTRVVDPTEEAIKLARLRSLDFGNREKAEAELARRGTYARSGDVAGSMAMLAGAMMNVFEGSLSDFANAMAAKFEVSQRDVLHLLRQEFVGVRRKAAETMRRQADGMPALVADDVDVEGDGGL
jgi:hypothetical protein